MRVLICIPKTIIPAAGAAYVAACLKRGGHEVHGHVFQDEQSLGATMRLGYDAVMTGGLSCSWKIIESVLKVAKDFGVPSVLGGGIVSAEPEIVTRALAPTYSVLGQGEVTAVEVLEVIAGRRSAETVPGLGYIRDGKYIQTLARQDVKDLDSLPFPDYEIFGFVDSLETLRPSALDYLSLWDKPREYALVASRSCPFHCTFCWHTSGDRYRRRSVDSVMQELEAVVRRYRINLVSILDELFGCSQEWLTEFCQRIKEFRKGLPWELHWWAALRAPMASPEMLRMIKDSGCVMVSYGFESYSKTVLDSMQKRISPADVEKALRLTHEAGLAVMAQFIFGDPAETSETIEETLTFWRKHPTIFLGTIFVCPDSPNYRLAIERGIIKDRLAHQKDIFQLLNLTTMSDDDFKRFAVRLLKLNVLNVPWPKVDYRGETLKVDCPHCSHHVRYGNFVLPPLQRGRVICRNCRKRFFVSRDGYRTGMRMLARCLPQWAWPYSLWRRVRKVADAING